MDFQQLLSRMKEIDSSPVQQPMTAEECGGMLPPPAMSAPISQSVQPPPSHPSMSVNLNAQGLDNIESMMKLFQKVNPDMMPKIAPPPMVTAMPGISAVKPQIPPMKMLPDFDADNNDKVGGEMDINIKPSGQGDLTKMNLDQDDIGSQPGKLGASLDRDGDGDHDMDDHDLEPKDDKEDKKEAWANEPQEEHKDIDYMVNKLAGGMNGPKDTYPKVAGGDNPMQRVKESEDSFRDSIRAELQKRLAEAKGVK